MQSLRATVLIGCLLTALTAHGEDYAALRAEMVRSQIVARGVEDPVVLAAMRRVPRHDFVPPERRHLAYRDRPLPIGFGQTISQPYIVASMTEELQLDADDRVLEIGTGSGYQAAVLAEITPHVFSIEIVEPLARSAARVLRQLEYDKVQVRHGDGWHGWPEAGPFDAIVVTAAPSQIPPPLIRQLKRGGRMVIPVGPAYATQTLVRVSKDMDGTVRTRNLYAVRFVPFTRSAGKTD
jgi:protein-L-isoaspartate(D-aspartate) O-methyltransferase